MIPGINTPGKFVDSGVTGGSGTIENSCSRCKHKHVGKTTCDAYPVDPPGRPMEIVEGEHDHTTPFPGDHGIRFEPLVDLVEGAAG